MNSMDGNIHIPLNCSYLAQPAWCNNTIVGKSIWWMELAIDDNHESNPLHTKRG